ncbi:unnamed protein product [Rangifer tarandus platyrhynchus]|uniref:Uncharacterized protein n=2 Tax=Rangifer tarandus platyrhynchus TaxID=3082113 RepID=A0ACB0ENX4_RANTA|nr:unnamed protein product [Rangifer tarandus platyrhynchus]CAI9702405.1 unnamed protein product [Rangifer tarandus platyrhynchus]
MPAEPGLVSGLASPPQPPRKARGVQTAPGRAAAPLGGRAGSAATDTPCVLRASRLQAELTRDARVQTVTQNQTKRASPLRCKCPGGQRGAFAAAPAHPV